MFEFSVFAVFFALMLVVIWRQTGQFVWFKLAIFWALYAGYEFMMFKRVWCTGECNIRVDLLLIFPLLVGRTLWVGGTAVAGWLRRRRQGRR